VLPCFGVAVGYRLERERASDIDQNVEPAEMRSRRIDGPQGLFWIRQIDPAEFDPVGGSTAVYSSAVDAGYLGAARDGGVRDDLAKCAGASSDDDDLSMH